MRIVTHGAAPQLPLPTDQDRQQLAALRTRVDASTDALGHFETTWSRDAIADTLAMDDLYVQMATAFAHGDARAAHSIASDMLVKTETTGSGTDFARLNLHWRIEGKEAPGGATTPATPEQAATASAIVADLGKLTYPQVDRAVAATETVMGTTSAAQSVSLAVQRAQEADGLGQQWLTSYALGDAKGAETARSAGADAWMQKDVYTQLMWMQMLKEGIEVAKPCTIPSCVEYSGPTPADDATAERLYDQVHRGVASAAKDLQLFGTWIAAASYTDRALPAAKTELTLAHDAANHADAVLHLHAAQQALYRGAYGLNVAGWNDASYFAIKTPAHPDPVGEKMNPLRNAYSSLRAAYAAERLREHATPAEAPPVASLPQKPWEPYPTGDPRKPQNVPPPAQSAFTPPTSSRPLG